MKEKVKTTTKKNKPGAGRPAVEIDLVELEKLLAMQSTDEEIAAWFGMSKQGISARKKKDPEFNAAYKRGKDKGRASLRRIMWLKANGTPGKLMRDDAGKVCFDEKGKAMWEIVPVPPDTTMQIWLSKNLLGYVDKLEHTGKNGDAIKTETKINVVSDTGKKLVEEILDGKGT